MADNWRRIETINEKNLQKKEFEKQQENLLNLISGNFNITMTEMKIVRSNINDLKVRLKHITTVLEEKVAKTEKKLETLKEQISESWDYQVDPGILKITERKLVDLEDRSWGNNLCIDRISKKENEIWDECYQEVQSVINVFDDWLNFLVAFIPDFKLGIEIRDWNIQKHCNRTSTLNKEKKGTVRIQENPEW